MLGKRIINTGAVSCTTDTTQILNAGSTESLALYRFEDNANDTSNSTGKFGKGAKFNGSSSDILVSGLNSMFSTKATFTVSLWFKTTATGNRALFDDYTSNNYNIQLYLYDGVVNVTTRFSGGDSNMTASSTTYNDGNWHHVAVTSNQTTYNTYIDGGSPSTWTASSNSHSGQTPTVTIGASQGGTINFFSGEIDQLRIFNKALSSSEINTLYNETSSTVNTLQILGDTSCIAAYTFEGNANDLSTNYNGTASNVIYDYSGTASNITYATGKFGKAAVFNGSNSNITLPTGLGSNGDRSRSFWINVDNLTNAVTIFYLGDSSSNAYYETCSVQTNGKIRYQERHDTSTNSVSIDSSSSIVAGTWYNIVYVFSDSVRTLYINGIQEAQTTSSYATVNNTSYPGFIGSFRNVITNTDGSIDQVRMFNKALSLGEINSLYNETATSAASATIDNPSTVAYYKMADGSDETGSYNGTATNVDFNVEGKYGFAGKFNGSNSYIDISTLDFPTNNFSVSAWVYLNSTPGSTTYNMILTTAKQNSGGYFYFTFYGTQLQYYHVAGGTSVIGGTVVAGQWNHVVLTQSSTGGAKVYLNDSVVASNTSLTANNTPNTTSGGVNTLGYYNTGSSVTGSLNGRMDQVRIFNKAISAAEVTTLYNEVQCADTIATPESYFNTVLFTPTTSTSALPVTGVGFSPGLAWAKYRGTGSGASTQSHYWVDTVRGINSRIFSNSSSAESTTNYVQSFDLDGITYVNNLFNRTGANSVVGWFWKAGSSNVTNNDGSITSTVSASPESGFSIVKWVSDGGSSISTKGHGLNKSLSFAIVKSLDSSSIWMIFQKDLPQNKYIQFSSDGLSPDGGTTYFSTTSTTLGFRDGSNSSSGDDMIAYCFHDVAGYQRSGTFVGNGETTGPYIYTGFEPAWIMIKRTDAAGAWNIFDNKRNSTNPRNSILQAAKSDQEYTNTNYNFNFYTNGFQSLNTNNDWNANGGNYIFLAMAANPDTSAPTKANSFNTLLYTGNDSNDRDITGLGFKPDFLWIKRRGSEPHALYDSVRGPNLQLTTHDTDIEATNSGSYLGMSSFDDDGFNVGNNGGTNRAPHPYVAWAWKGLDHDRNLSAINNDGSIPSSVSANIAAGFSIVSYTGNATSGATVGHGLGGELDLLIVKSRNLTQAWNVYVKGVTDTNAKYLRLNESNNIYTTVNPRFIPGNFNDNVFSIGSDNACNGNNDKYIAYCFRSISGYSKVGTYTGSGASGKTVATGFEPSWVMIKNVTTSGLSWAIFDNKRSTANPRNLVLWPDSSGTEYTQTNGLNFNPTGFEVINTTNWLNKSGDTLIYMAFK